MILSIYSNRCIFYIMLTNIKITKKSVQPHLPNTVISPSPTNSSTHPHQNIKRQIGNLMATVLNFGQDSSESTTAIKQMCTKLSKCQVVEIWNQVIKTQMDKFIAKVNCVLALKRGNVQSLSLQMINRINKCASKIKDVIQQVSSRGNWCLCEREICLSRFCCSQTEKRLKNYCLLKISSNIIAEKLPQPLFDQQMKSMNFINIGDDQKCNLLSLDHLQNRNGKGKQGRQKIGKNVSEDYKKRGNLSEQCNAGKDIIQYLQQLKILENQRTNCWVDVEWAEKIKYKFHTQQ